VKWIGNSRGKDGKLRPKCHYLGDNESNAVARAIALLAEWKTLKADGKDAWPPSTLPTVPASSASTTRGERSAAPDAPNPSLTVEEGSKQYLAVIRAERDAQQVTPQHYESMRYKVARIVSYLGPKKTLSSIGEREIKAFVLLVAQRPLVRDKARPERPMSLNYAKRIVADCKWFLNWLYESELWNERPRNFNRLFRFKAVLTVQERASQLEQGRAEPPHFTVDQLAKLYAVACDRHRLWMLLSLNCGFAQAELNSLHRFEVKNLDSKEPFIERFRQKTQVYARWSLWPETAHLLRRYIARPNPDDLALFTERGRRLKSVAPSGVYSGVSEAWRVIVRRSGVQGTYKLLRKTGAWMTKQIGGLEVSEMYLAHQEPGMNKAYAGRRWDKLDVALAEMRKQLEPMLRAGGHCGEMRFRQATFNESNGFLPFPVPPNQRHADSKESSPKDAA
jgi:integrase